MLMLDALQGRVSGWRGWHNPVSWSTLSSSVWRGEGHGQGVAVVCARAAGAARHRIRRTLLRQGYTRTSGAQHVCFLAHLDRWMSAESIGLAGLSGPIIERYLDQRRAAGYVEYRSMKALRPLLGYLGRLGVLPEV